MDNVADNLESLASVGINDGSDLGFSHDDVADVEGGGEAPRAYRNRSRGWTKLRRSPPIGWGVVGCSSAITMKPKSLVETSIPREGGAVTATLN